MPRYSFKVDPCPPEEGYGWVLRYFEDGWEIPGQELFVAPVDATDILQEEYDNALITGELWIEAQPNHEPGLAELPVPEKNEAQLELIWSLVDNKRSE
ncbi:hypothetical protein [Vreelandella piezotolerans]|uniref:hypothetical protein n=1 Tax=Vreelandella piezotolerans TaxID=2609667 RepID=UPI001C63950C|nr:hypothetical protein [Halomonas piezotolerans]